MGGATTVGVCRARRRDVGSLRVMIFRDLTQFSWHIIGVDDAKSTERWVSMPCSPTRGRAHSQNDAEHLRSLTPCPCTLLSSCTIPPMRSAGSHGVPSPRDVLCVWRATCLLVCPVCAGGRVHEFQ